MAEDYQRLMQEISDMKRRLAGMVRTGTVAEVKGDKLRAVIAKDSDGKEVLSPWLNTSNHRGGSTESRYYKKGQTVSIICPGGDISQGMIAPFAPNEKFPRPEQANESGEGEESYQLEDYRQKQTKDGVDMWLQDTGGQSSGNGHSGGQSARLKTRLNADGGITHRIGKDMRLAVHKKGVKMRAKNDFVLIYEDEKKQTKIVFSRPPILFRDKIPNDDN